MSVERKLGGVVVHDNRGQSESYDQVVVAVHSDQALAMLADADETERAVLGSIGYATNRIYLHRDVRLMPRRRQARASWNFLKWPRSHAAGNDVAVTYRMNILQAPIPPTTPVHRRCFCCAEAAW